MRKAILISGILLASIQLAMASDINSSISRAIKTGVSDNSAQTVLPIVYGGKDIRRHFAVADETVSGNDNVLIG